MLYMILEHLPDPVKAQAYRIQNIYEGPVDDEVSMGRSKIIDRFRL